MMSNDALIQDLTAGLTPVRRRSVLREALALAALAGAELALVLGAGAMRPDMGRMILTPYMLWKLGSLALLTGLCCAIAVRSFSPTGSLRRGLGLVLGLAGLAVIGGTFVTSAADSVQPLLERLSPVHGLMCSASIVLLALPIVAMLAVLMRRGAPVHPRKSALAAGLAASTCGALIFAFCCPMNDPLYIVVWYSVAIAVVAATARWLLPRHFRL